MHMDKAMDMDVRRNSESKTPYDIMGKASPAATFWTDVATLAAVFGYSAAENITIKAINEAYGIDMYKNMALHGQYYIIPMFVFFGLLYLVGRSARSLVRRGFDARFVRAFAKDPRCYNCGHSLPGIVYEEEAGDPGALVVACPRCGTACPAVCVKDRKLVPVRAPRTGA